MYSPWSPEVNPDCLEVPKTQNSPVSMAFCIMAPRADILRFSRLIVASKPSGTKLSISSRALDHLAGSAVAAILAILNPSSSVNERVYVLSPVQGSIPIWSVRQAGINVGGMAYLFSGMLTLYLIGIQLNKASNVVWPSISLALGPLRFPCGV